ncbi:hypothetical protein BH24CHL5_BH24CHL5_08090 [soil metagenome]
MTRLAEAKVGPAAGGASVNGSGPTNAGARVLDGRPLAAQIKARVRRQAGTFRRRDGFSPILAADEQGQTSPS